VGIRLLFDPKSRRQPMKKFLITAVIATVSVLSLASLASSQTSARTVKFSASLNIGQEVPHPKGTKVGAIGHFDATLSGTTLTWSLTFDHLSGPASASHIHAGLRGKAGPVMVPLCGPCKSPASGTATGLTADQIKTLTSGGTYVNVHTAKNPNGEIRGQITVAR
jgi:hypothetical protein